MGLIGGGAQVRSPRIGEAGRDDIHRGRQWGLGGTRDAPYRNYAARISNIEQGISNDEAAAAAPFAQSRCVARCDFDHKLMAYNHPTSKS